MPGTATRGLAALAVAFLVSSTSLRAELVSRWPLDGDLLDVAPLANHGELAEGGTPRFVAGVDGREAGALALDGVSEHVEITTRDALPVSVGPRFSVALWVRATATTEGAALYAEESAATGAGVTLGTAQGDTSGRLALAILDDDGVPLVNFARSERIVLDGEWHHVALVEADGRLSLWIDGERDLELTHEVRTLHVDQVTLGAALSSAGARRLAGDLDEVRVYDHPLSPLEIEHLHLPDPGCPATGDTHCGRLEVDRPPGDGEGRHLVRFVDAIDDSGDAITFHVSARAADGREVHAAPALSSEVALDLPAGEWTIRGTVDDSSGCPDLAADASCELRLDVGCPAEGDTHCGEIVVFGPRDGGPGEYVVQALDSFDESGDAILYSLLGESEEGRTLRLGPQPGSTFVLSIPGGRWTFSITVDDDLACPDVAADATCSTFAAADCPADGDSSCGDLLVEITEGGVPGYFTARLEGAGDASGDALSTVFEAVREDGARMTTEPLATDSFTFALPAGEWTLRATVDDDPFCSDRWEADTCEETLTVAPDDARLVSRWPFDGDLLDVERSANHGEIQNLDDPVASFTDGFDGTADGALLLDGEDHMLVPAPPVRSGVGLPVSAQSESTIAFWVRADPVAGAVIWSETSLRSPDPHFVISSDPVRASGRLTVDLRGEGGVHPIASRTSTRVALDGTWHHVAWVDANGNAALYIDGVRDATDFRYRRTLVGAERVSLGALDRGGASAWLVGAIDELRVYTRALTASEIAELIPEPVDCPDSGDTRVDGLEVERPASGRAGLHRLQARGAVDTSGDPVLYTFRATRDDGRVLQAGPGLQSSAELSLDAGSWTLEVEVDDDLDCRDTLPDATASERLVVERDPPTLIAHWPFDLDLRDVAGEHHGSIRGAEQPEFAAGHDGGAIGALRLDGRDDAVVVLTGDGLPAATHDTFTIAFWTRGGPQNDKVVYAESARADDRPRFRLGPSSRSSSGRLEVVLRDASGARIIWRALSVGTVFDETWHHVAWTVTSEGRVSLFIDGARDEREWPVWSAVPELDLVTIGAHRSADGVSADGASSFAGDLDEMRIYNHALDEEEIARLAGVTSLALFRRGDVTTEGSANISDAVFLLRWLFSGGAMPSCAESADVNDDGVIVLSDAVFLLDYLFRGGTPVPPPGLDVLCGEDPPGSPSLGCERYDNCP